MASDAKKGFFDQLYDMSDDEEFTSFENVSLHKTPPMDRITEPLSSSAVLLHLESEDLEEATTAARSEQIQGSKHAVNSAASQKRSSSGKPESPDFKRLKTMSNLRDVDISPLAPRTARKYRMHLIPKVASGWYQKACLRKKREDLEVSSKEWDEALEVAREQKDKVRTSKHRSSFDLRCGSPIAETLMEKSAIWTKHFIRAVMSRLSPDLLRWPNP